MPDVPPSVVAMTQAARAAAASLEADFRDLHALRIEEKGPSDFVSSADLRSQEILQRELSKLMPGPAFLMEEGDVSRARKAEARFVVDPLDGTTNFLHGLPHFAISVALEERGTIVAGVILDVAKRERFWAALGQGAWLEERRLEVAREKDPSRAVIGAGIPHRGRGEHASYLESLGRVMRDVAGIRRFGAAALDLAYVAAGRLDAFFEKGLAPWDVAAGLLLVREAGGRACRSDGSPLESDIDSADVLVAGAPAIHELMLEALRPRS
jgi:myo-inositol-1(or 4)-monophosphatase